MTRKKVKFALIESIIGRKASYIKRQKEFLKKAHELSTLCDIEMAIVIYSPYHNEPKVFPNHDDAINTFTKFMELSVLKQSKNMVTQEEFTKQRIKKIEEQLQKVRKKNRVMKFTKKINELLNDKDILVDMHSYDLIDLIYVTDQNLKQVREVMKMKIDETGSTSNAPQPIVETMVPSGTSSERPRAPLLDLVEAPVSVVSLRAPSTVPSRTNSEEPRTPLLVPIVAPISMVPPASPISMVPPASPISMVPPTSLSMVSPTSFAQVPQPMFHPVDPLKTPPQTVPLVNASWISPSTHPPPLFSSQMFPPMVLQMYPPIPQQMALRRGPGKAPPIPPTIVASPMPSPMMDRPMSAPVISPMTSQINLSMNIPQMDASMPMNNYQNYSIGFSQSPALSEMLEWNDADDIMTFFNDSSFNNINVQDSNCNNNF